jgi:carboxylesterase type B
VFRGIPYAAPPVGEFRWKSPQPLPCWSGVRDATRFGEVCAQPGTRHGSETTWFGSEDCLYLNVWTPRDRQPGARLPVLFFVHGGSNVRGSGSETFQLGPIVDGVVVTSQPVVKFQSPHAASVPLLFSSADQEAAFSLFGLMFTGPIATADDFTAALESLAPASIVPGIQAEYPLAKFATPRQALTAVLTDANNVCPARRIARTVASSGGAVWRAAWMHTASSGPARAFGPAHVTDVPYWFNTLNQMPQSVPTDAERALAQSMSRYLVVFATTGEPNTAGAPTWPRYKATTDEHLVLDNDITTGRGFHAETCDFWDANLLPAGYRSNP